MPEGQLEWWYGADGEEGIRATGSGLLRLFVGGELRPTDWIQHRSWNRSVCVSELIRCDSTEGAPGSGGHSGQANAWAAVVVTALVVLFGALLSQRRGLRGERALQAGVGVEVDVGVPVGSVAALEVAEAPVDVELDVEAPEPPKAALAVGGTEAVSDAILEDEVGTPGPSVADPWDDPSCPPLLLPGGEEQMEALAAEAPVPEEENVVGLFAEVEAPTAEATLAHVEWMHEALWAYLEDVAGLRAEMPGMTSVELVARRCALLEEAVDRAQASGVDPLLEEVHTRVLETARLMLGELEDAVAAYRGIRARYGAGHKMVNDVISHRRKRFYVDQLEAAMPAAAAWSRIQEELPARYPAIAGTLRELLGEPCFVTAEEACQQVVLQASGVPTGAATLAMFERCAELGGFDYRAEVNRALAGWATIVFPESWVQVQEIRHYLAGLKRLDSEGVDEEAVAVMQGLIAFMEEGLDGLEFEHCWKFGAADDFAPRPGVIRGLGGITGQLAREQRARRLEAAASRRRSEERACLRRMAQRYPQEAEGFRELLRR